MNSWPSIQTVLYDGWIIRSAYGVTKRSNSVSPLYNSSLLLENKIKFCEDYYFSKDLPCIFKLTSFSEPKDLDFELGFRGYNKVDESHMMTLDMSWSFEFTSDNIEFVKPKEWIETYAKLNGITRKEILLNLLEGSSAKNHYGILKFNNTIVACGLLSIQDSIGGIFHLVVDETLRRRGFGKELMGGLILKARSEKVITTYLQVSHKNNIARNLYLNLGFQDEYKYWYRIRNTP
ncbi:MAG: GNAT family N-acetyltransferase [Leptospiraceae bacterium]|nr:GNAT family N-acetyltransferase [Leptospiraceae bacterium]